MMSTSLTVSDRRCGMPTVSRFLTFILVVAGLALAVVLALAYLVPPDTRPMTAPVDAAVLGAARPVDPPSPPPAAASSEAMTDGANDGEVSP